MRLHEYEAMDIFKQHGIPVPEGEVATTPEEAQKVARRLGCPVVLKAQVLVGGRGLAGGIRMVHSPEEAQAVSAELLGSEIRGFPVRLLLIAKEVAIEEELYMGITVDGYEGKPVVLVSTEGGMNIEEVAKRSPEKIASLHVRSYHGLFPYEARGLLGGLGLPPKGLLACTDLLVRLYKVFVDCNALIAEINPLARVSGGGLVALDAVLEVDDSALHRLGSKVSSKLERIENPLERKGREIGVTYVDMEGDIGIISSGAGLGMATMDIVARKLRPANFLETGGGITEELLYRTMELMMMKEGLRAIFINIYGGINPIHEGARGIVRYIEEHDVRIPIVAKALGNRQEETWEIFRSGGVHVVTEVSTEKAVDYLFEILGV
ncbi:MAG: acetate--CoA ligase family protein [Candidatus Hydrogenedentota bacterium]|nr:MAG: acetate--CoA ligase family protein [Candidatus Hydrogenedentota bacterium]